MRLGLANTMLSLMKDKPRSPEFWARLLHAETALERFLYPDRCTDEDFESSMQWWSDMFFEAAKARLRYRGSNGNGAA